MKATTPLDNVRIVLSHPSHPGNIGAVARAMKTMGLSKLYLVNPKLFPDKQADAMAAGATDVLQNAVICASVQEALQGTVLAAAVTARGRDLSHPAFDARQGAQQLVAEQISELPQPSEHSQSQPVAVVFGTEMSGLSAAEVSLCQIIISIPTNPDFSSLNLASAVQVVAYELRMALPADQVAISPLSPLSPDLRSMHRQPLASFEEIEFFYEHFEKVLITSGFLNPQEPRKLMQRIRRLFARARLEKDEVNILRGILTALEQRKLNERRD